MSSSSPSRGYKVALIAVSALCFVTLASSATAIFFVLKPQQIPAPIVTTDAKTKERLSNVEAFKDSLNDETLNGLLTSFAGNPLRVSLLNRAIDDTILKSISIRQEHDTVFTPSTYLSSITSFALPNSFFDGGQTTFYWNPNSPTSQDATLNFRSVLPNPNNSVASNWGTELEIRSSIRKPPFGDLSKEMQPCNAKIMNDPEAKMFVHYLDSTSVKSFTHETCFPIQEVAIKSRYPETKIHAYLYKKNYFGQDLLPNSDRGEQVVYAVLWVKKEGEGPAYDTTTIARLTVDRTMASTPSDFAIEQNKLDQTIDTFIKSYRPSSCGDYGGCY